MGTPREKAKRPAVGTPENLEVTAIERQHVTRPVASGHNHDGGIGQPDTQFGMAFDR
jgi:hypothetical protein